MPRIHFPYASAHQEQPGVIQLKVAIGSDDIGIYFYTSYKKRLRLSTLSKKTCAGLHPITLQAAAEMLSAGITKKIYWLSSMPSQQIITVELCDPIDLQKVTNILTDVFEANGLVVSGELGDKYLNDGRIALPCLSGMLPVDHRYFCEGGQEALVAFLKEATVSIRNKPDEDFESIV